jgi:hypothetical protein
MGLYNKKISEEEVLRKRIEEILNALQEVAVISIDYGTIKHLYTNGTT